MAIVDADRVMAFVTQIKNISSIEGLDKLELIILKCGFQSIVDKNIFNIGDYVIFVTEDSVFENDEVIKRKKIRGTISHGLILSLISSNTEYNKYNLSLVPKEEGYDCTKILCLRKFVKQSEKSQYIEKNLTFPVHIVPKTDEIRIQSNLELLDKLKDFVITRKEDGSSATFFFHEKFYMCSRNFEVSYSEKSIYKDVCDKFDIRKICEENPSLAFQGEIVGPKINKNMLKLNEIDFKVFNIYDIKEKKYLIWNDVIKICERIGFNIVPTITSDAKTLEDFTKLSNEIMYSNSQHAEGIVIKEKDNSISFKVLSDKY